MNVHDSEKMLGILSGNGFSHTESPEDADLIIFNTCAIREKAEQKFYSQLGRTGLLKKKRGGIKIAVTGCVAQDVQDKLFKKAPFVDFILGPQNIYSIHDMVLRKKGKSLLGDNPEAASLELEPKRQSRIKAWVSIMHGCNNFCSYCIVPYTRGREVSRPSSSILSEISSLAADGYREITLLGQNVNSYRSDIGFSELLKKVNDISTDRVRFVTSHPRDLSPDLIRTVADLPNVCEHIHLPIQSGSDRILREMNRGYTYREYREKITLLREHVPGISITADVIAGFPGETEEDHLATLRALQEIEFDGIFAFKYSPRKGTKAYEMGERVSEDAKAVRLDSILKIQGDITFRKNKMLEGSIQEILLEGPSEADPSMLTGRTRTNKIVTIKDCGQDEGSAILVRIEKARPYSLFGTAVDKLT